MTVGTAIAFPAELPSPQELPSQSAERRVIPDAGPFDPAIGQTDRLGQEDYIFPPYSPDQAEALYAFWKDTLNEGAKWFAASWPRPEGAVPTARRFVRPPSLEFIQTPLGGYWRAIGSFEIRGAGELPVEPAPPSAWNPDDKIALDLPPPLALTEDNRLATRVTTLTEYEAGVRGTLSHGTRGKYYFELEVVSNGDATDEQNQDMQFGMVDSTMLNESYAPLNDSSNPATGGNFLLASNRYDGICWSSQPTYMASPGTFGTKPSLGAIYGFAWDVGTSVAVYRDGVLGFTAAFSYVGQMFPYFNAGSTNASGGDPGDSGESVRIRTGKKQFAHQPPAGFIPWG